MNATAERDFPAWFKIVVDRVCKARGLTRQALADELGVHIHSVSTAGFRGQVGWPLIRRLAEMAGMRPEEMAEMEWCWIQMRSTKTSDEALQRSVSIVDALLEQITSMEEWLSGQDLFEEFRRSENRDVLVRRMRRLMREGR